MKRQKQREVEKKKAEKAAKLPERPKAEGKTKEAEVELCVYLKCATLRC